MQKLIRHSFAHPIIQFRVASLVNQTVSTFKVFWVIPMGIDSEIIRNDSKLGSIISRIFDVFLGFQTLLEEINEKFNISITLK